MPTSVRVSPTEPNPTHHISLKDRSGMELGFTLCDDKGDPLPLSGDHYIKNPVETTAQKQTSGASSYDIFDYPYSPIVQDDLSGGRGNLDFERDSTRYYDSFRCRSGRANKAYAGPLEQYVEGNAVRSADMNMPGSVRWIPMMEGNRYIYKRFRAGASYTIGQLWTLVRKVGTPADLTMTLYSDDAGAPDTLLTSVTVPNSRMADTLMEWLNETVSQAVTAGSYYWLVVYAADTDGTKKHWKIAVNNAAGTTYASDAFTTSPTSANFDLYFRVCTANAEQTCIPFEYKEGQYFIISGVSGAPRLFMAGDRGAADSNAGQLNKLIDATKAWTENEWVGSVVMITDGDGKLEAQPYRVVTSNNANTLTLDSSWTIAHTTNTEYVILGTKLKEITGHGLTAPISSVFVSPQGIVYYCMGDGVTVRRGREYNNAGTWTAEWADETATTKATFMLYKPGAQKIVIGNNSDANGDVSINFSTNNAPGWGTAITWGTAKPVGSKYRRINGMIIHPDIGGTEQVWVFKTDIPWIVPESAVAYEVTLSEMKTVRSLLNGKNPIRHGLYLYFPVQQGYERYYGGQFDDVGPNLGEGLPLNRRGPVVSAVGYPGKLFVAIDAGNGYSSVLDSNGWHERYRAPKGQRITAMAFQVVHGTTPDRLWLYQGNDLIWLPFPSDSTIELEDANYQYTPEFSVTLARMHAGILDIQKLVKMIKLQTEQLETDPTTGEPICWFELDYRRNEETEWTAINEIFDTSPTDKVDFTSQLGLSGKRIQLRLRGYTTDSRKTPILLAIIISAVIRVDVKNIYGPFTFRIMDNEQTFDLHEDDNTFTAADKLHVVEAWGDASNDSMLLMQSVSPLCHEKIVFLNVGTRRQIAFKGAGDNKSKSDIYLVSATMQEA